MFLSLIRLKTLFSDMQASIKRKRRVVTCQKLGLGVGLGVGLETATVVVPVNPSRLPQF